MDWEGEEEEEEEGGEHNGVENIELGDILNLPPQMLCQCL